MERRVAGTDSLDVMSIVGVDDATTAKPATAIGLLKSYKLVPGAFAGTRLAQEAAMWQRWRPNRICFRVTSSAGAAVGGLLMGAWLASPKVTIPTDATILRRLLTASPSHYTTRMWESGQVVVNQAPVQRILYLTGSDEDSAHGQVVFCLLAQASADCSLVVEMDWDITFSGPLIA